MSVARAGVPARTVAWEIVRAVHRDGAWAGPAADRALRATALDARDRAFASNLAFQTLRWQGTLDWALGHVVRRPLEQVDSGLLDLLRIGAWQVLYGRMPDRAAVSATVEVARQRLPARTVGFANGVLRGLARRRRSLPWPAEDTVEGRALRTGYPAWVVREADIRFGSEADRQLAAGNDPAGLTVRTADAARLRDGLVAMGADATPGALTPDALHVEGVAPAAVLDRFPDAVIQDEASIVVARVVDAVVAPGGAILAPCAAPGGKATHLAALGHPVTAADRHHGRLRLVADLADRLGLSLRLAVADGTRPPWRPDRFDGVLLDAPCSGLGVVRRRPELRWRRGPDDVPSLAALQRDLLDASATVVTPGGALVYSVCTWTRAETVDVTTAFLADHPAYVAEPLAVPGVPWHDEREGPGMQLTPAEHGCDGMYIAVLRRRD